MKFANLKVGTKLISAFFTLLIVLTAQPICFAQDRTPEKKIMIGAIVPTLSAEFWNRYVAFLKKGAAELDVRVMIINADNKVDSMHSHLKLLLDMKVDGLIYVPYWNSGRMGLKLAAEADVPVILTDVYIPGVRPQRCRDITYIKPTQVKG